VLGDAHGARCPAHGGPTGGDLHPADQSAGSNPDGLSSGKLEAAGVDEGSGRVGWQGGYARMWCCGWLAGATQGGVK
jgi:hypothetical protein